MAYAWTDIHAGGDVEEISRANGQVMRVITNRNVIKRGDEVSQKDLDVSDEEWEALLASGSVREAELPEGADDYTSPATAIMQNLVDEDGNIDMNKLIDIGLAQPDAVPVEEEVPAPTTTSRAKADVPKGA